MLSKLTNTYGSKASNVYFLFNTIVGGGGGGEGGETQNHFENIVETIFHLNVFCMTGTALYLCNSVKPVNPSFLGLICQLRLS